MSGPISSRYFASDNYAGILPEVLSAIASANEGHARAYGDDAHTAALSAAIERTFGAGALAFPVFNGTAANVLALAAVTRRWGAVVCAESAHVHADEGGAPEAVAGLKLWTVRTPDGKLTPALLAAQLFDADSVHRAAAGAVSITQTTELGTLYSPDEVRALAACAHAHGLALHMDGARLANAAAALALPMRAFTTDAGVDVLSLGGTKAGALAAEAVVLLPGASGGAAGGAAAALPFLRKTVMQLASKQRFVAAQLTALLATPPGAREPLAVARAAHANAMAQRLERGLRALPHAGLVMPPHAAAANAVFPTLPRAVTDALLARTRFYVWDHATGQVRFMCAWDTTPEDVDALVGAVDDAFKALPIDTTPKDVDALVGAVDDAFKALQQ
jgi:threonine aldolase